MGVNLWEIIKKVGPGIIGNVVPGGSAILGIVNTFLPADKKLPLTATGDQVSNVISNLPPEQQVQLYNKQFDLDITQIKESNETIRVMLTADATSTHTTRPKIALGSFRVLAFVVVVVISLWSYSVATANVLMITAIVNGWPFVLAIVGPLIGILNAYFGILRKESSDKLNASNNQPTGSGIGSLIGSLFNRDK